MLGFSYFRKFLLEIVIILLVIWSLQDNAWLDFID